MRLRQRMRSGASPFSQQRSSPVSQQRHRKFALSSESRRILKDWFDDHESHPYPSHYEKVQLAKAAQMSLKQVLGEGQRKRASDGGNCEDRKKRNQ
ncbi:MAG: hypothetical protein SGPRY_006680 [Prymnesium sp.]